MNAFASSLKDTDNPSPYRLRNYLVSYFIPVLRGAAKRSTRDDSARVYATSVASLSAVNKPIIKTVKRVL